MTTNVMSTGLLLNFAKWGFPMATDSYQPSPIGQRANIKRDMIENIQREICTYLLAPYIKRP